MFLRPSVSPLSFFRLHGVKQKQTKQILLSFVFRNQDKLMNTRLKTSLVIIVETFSSCLEHVLSFILTSSRALHIWASVKRDTGSRFCRTVPRNGRGFLMLVLCLFIWSITVINVTFIYSNNRQPKESAVLHVSIALCMYVKFRLSMDLNYR